MPPTRLALLISLQQGAALLLPAQQVSNPSPPSQHNRHTVRFRVSVWSGPVLWVGVRVMYPRSVMWIHSSGPAGQR
jgi:hypothetical protein